MTLQELVNETLVEKNRRIRRMKCRHMEVYSSWVSGPTGIFGNVFCLDCGQLLSRDHSPQGSEDANG